jgi:hypothetical protein
VFVIDRHESVMLPSFRSGAFRGLRGKRRMVSVTFGRT